MHRILHILKKQLKSDEKKAKSDLKIKMAAEKTFMRELNSLFNRMMKDFLVQYSASSQIMNVDDYQNDWSALFKKHYDRVQNAFMGTVLKGVDLDEDIITKDEILTAVSQLLLEWRNETAPRQAEITNQTTSKDMYESVRRALDDSARDGLPMDRRSIGLLATAYLRRKTNPRKESIAVFQTQSAAESTKNIEALETGRQVRERRPDVFVAKDTKSWQDMGDKKVRPSHTEATQNNQHILIDEPFRVGDSLMMYPTDTSLGASLREIMRCRCSAIYFIKGRFK